MMSYRIPSVQRICYGGLLGVFLSIILAEYISAALYQLYHNSFLIRDTTGISPNKISAIFLKLSWALVCLTSWWMLWKLDFLLAKKPAAEVKADEKPKQKKAEDHPPPKARKKSDKKAPSEEEKSIGENPKDAEKPKNQSAKPSLKDIHYAKILGVKDVTDSEEIKSRYRKKIAQYHPDRVRAMGPEIREIADRKAKEINEAHEHFRKKAHSQK